MNRRMFLTLLACMAFALSLVAVFQTTQKLHALERQQSRVPAQTTAAPSVEVPANPGVLQESAPEELLRLRAEVTRLTRVKSDLASHVARVTNTSTGIKGQTNVVALPPGYIRKSNAAFMGYSTPENSIQSLLWAIQAKDVDRVTQAFAPEAGAQIKLAMERQGSDDFFKQGENIPGMLIKERRDLEDGMVELKIEVIPGVPDGASSSVKMKQINGEWKIASPM